MFMSFALRKGVELVEAEQVPEVLEFHPADGQKNIFLPNQRRGLAG